MFLNEAYATDVEMNLEESAIEILEAQLEFTESYSNIRHTAVLLEYKALTESDEVLKEAAEQGFFKKAWEAVKAFFARIVTAVKAFFSYVKGKLVALWNKMFTSSTMQDKKVTVKSKTAELTDAISELIAGLDSDKPAAQKREIAAKVKTMIAGTAAKEMEKTIKEVKTEADAAVAALGKLEAAVSKADAKVKTLEGKYASAKDADKVEAKEAVDEATESAKMAAFAVSAVKQLIAGIGAEVKTVVAASGGEKASA